MSTEKAWYFTASEESPLLWFTTYRKVCDFVAFSVALQHKETIMAIEQVKIFCIYVTAGTEENQKGINDWLTERCPNINIMKWKFIPVGNYLITIIIYEET